MQLEQGLWAYCPRNDMFGELYYTEGFGWGLRGFDFFGGFTQKYFPTHIDWPNLEIFTMREVK